MKKRHTTLLHSVWVLLISASILSVNVDAKEQINVGAGLRVPYLFDNQTGLTIDVINALNSVQNDYQFVVLALPVKRKYESIQQGWIDIVVWDNPNWGWDEKSVVKSMPLVVSKDLFITLKTATRNQAYFNDLTTKSLIGINGFHYRFADFETNIAELKRRFKINLVRNEQDAINMVLKGRGEIAIVNDVSLAWFLKRNTDAANKLLVSSKYDTKFERYFLIPKSTHKITAKMINRYLQLADKQGLLTAAYRKYAVPKPEFCSEKTQN